MPSHACCLLALCLAVSSAYRLQLSTPTPRAYRSRLPRLSSADPPPDDRDNDTKMEDDALAAAFAARLEQEGGATQFKIKTTIGGAADELKDGAGKVVGSAKDLASVGKDGLLNADAWQLVVGLLAGATPDQLAMLARYDAMLEASGSVPQPPVNPNADGRYDDPDEEEDVQRPAA